MPISFRRFERANAAVMRRMHVADFEARAFTRQTARSEGRNATLVRHFRQRIVLVHELRELRRTEELLDRCRYRLGIDQVLRRQVLGFSQRKDRKSTSLNSSH